MAKKSLIAKSLRETEIWREAVQSLPVLWEASGFLPKV